MSRAPLTGWGRTAPTYADLRSPTKESELRDALRSAGRRGVIARGLGRSYGDPAQNAGGTVVSLDGLPPTLDLDQDAGRVRVGAGVSLDVLLRAVLPDGWWIPVLPGTRQVTVGGAIAADVHGKNHHHDGSFGQHVVSMRMMLASGDVVDLEPCGAASALFWATVGGMGLTGVVLDAVIDLHRVETSYFVVDTDRTPDLATMLDVLTAGDAVHPYSVAWFDTATRGRDLARGVVTQGRSARLDELDADRRAAALELAAPTLGAVPFAPPVRLVNRLTARAFNALWFAKAPERRRDEVQDITQFFHPLDVVGDWNRVYGRAGFCQYQCVVPFGAESALTEIVERIAHSTEVSSLNVLKRFGPGDDAPLSFPTAGWTLAVDLPVTAGLGALLDDLDAVVLSAGGRLYLAKDSRATARTIHAMYPRLPEFLAIRDEVDPGRVFTSDLARRLDLTGAHRD